jgi:hypothetical protein
VLCLHLPLFCAQRYKFSVATFSSLIDFDSICPISKDKRSID